VRFAKLVHSRLFPNNRLKSKSSAIAAIVLQQLLLLDLILSETHLLLSAGFKHMILSLGGSTPLIAVDDTKMPITCNDILT